MGLAVGAERERQRLLGRGLADRAGDRDDLAPPSAPAPRRRDRAAPRARRRRRCSGASSPKRVAHGRRHDRARPPRAPPPALSAAATKSWPSWTSPLMAKKASPGAMVRLSIEMPVIACRQRADAGAARRRVDRLRRPQRGHARRLGRERRRDRLVIGERHDLVADDLAGLVALAGDQQHVAALELGDRAADRLAAVADLAGARRRRSGWRRGSRRDPRCADCRR